MSNKQRKLGRCLPRPQRIDEAILDEERNNADEVLQDVVPKFDAFKRIVHDDVHTIRDVNLPKNSSNSSTLGFTFRGNWKTLNLVYTSLKSGGLKRVKDTVDKSGFCMLFEEKMPPSDQRLVSALLKRWWNTTHTFQFAELELGFTPVDFTIFTSISIGNGDVPLYDDGAYGTMEEVYQKYFPELCGTAVSRSGAIPVATLHRYFKKIDKGGLGLFEKVEKEDAPQELVERMARVFLMYSLGQLFFPDASSSVNKGWLASFERLDEIGRFDWGGAIYARLLSSLDIICVKGESSVNCMWQVLEYWFYEYCGVCNPVMKNNRTQKFPRIRMWASSERVRAGDRVSHNMGIASSQIEMRTPDSITWQPFETYPYRSEACVVRAFQLSRRRVLFVDPQFQGFWYLGDRCWRQLMGQIAIPHDPPVPMSQIIRGHCETLQARGWSDARQYVYLVDQKDYSAYWRHVSYGPALPAVLRYVNIDLLGGSSRADPTVHVPESSSLVYEPRLYPLHTVLRDSLPYSSWKTCVAGSDNTTLTIDVPPTSARYTLPDPHLCTQAQWREYAYDTCTLSTQMHTLILDETRRREHIIWERDQCISARDATIAERDATIATLEAKIEELEAQDSHSVAGNDSPTQSVDVDLKIV